MKDRPTHLKAYAPINSPMHPLIAILVTMKTGNPGSIVGDDDGNSLGELDTDGMFDGRADKLGDCVGSFEGGSDVVGKEDGFIDIVGKADGFDDG